VKRLFAIALGKPMALLPRRFRFGAALTATRLLRRPVWLIRRNLRGMWLSGSYDETLRILLRSMIVSGVRFDPHPELDVPAGFLDELRRSGGMIVTGHFILNTLMTRYLHDHGFAPVPVKTYPELDPCVWGTDVPVEVIKPSPNVLVQVRSRLAAKRPVILALDSDHPGPTSTPVETPAGTYYVSPAALELARRMGMPVWFACVRAQRNRPPIFVARRIEPELAAYIALLEEQTRAVEA
jgi:hypothetical protein